MGGYCAHARTHSPRSYARTHSPRTRFLSMPCSEIYVSAGSSSLMVTWNGLAGALYIYIVKHGYVAGRSASGAWDCQNMIENLRLMTAKHEVIVAPGRDYTLIVLQEPHKNAVSGDDGVKKVEKAE